MVARLGDFLRLTLRSSTTQQISLAEELEFLRLSLQVRFFLPSLPAFAVPLQTENYCGYS